MNDITYEIISGNIKLGIVKSENIKKICVFLGGYDAPIENTIDLMRLEDFAEKYGMMFVVVEDNNRFYISLENYICEVIPRYIRDKYAHLADIDLYLAGVSMGGFGALLNGFLRPDSYKAVIALSSALLPIEFSKGNKLLFASDEQYAAAKRILGLADDQLPYEVRDNTRVNPLALVEALDEEVIMKLPPVYMACGKSDIWYRSNKELESVLNKRAVDYLFTEYEGGHDDDLFLTAFNNILECVC